VIAMQGRATSHQKPNQQTRTPSQHVCHQLTLRIASRGCLEQSLNCRHDHGGCLARGLSGWAEV
jgi:hypothetical protein